MTPTTWNHGLTLEIPPGNRGSRGEGAGRLWALTCPPPAYPCAGYFVLQTECENVHISRIKLYTLWSNWHTFMSVLYPGTWETRMFIVFLNKNKCIVYIPRCNLLYWLLANATLCQYIGTDVIIIITGDCKIFHWMDL